MAPGLPDPTLGEGDAGAGEPEAADGPVEAIEPDGDGAAEAEETAVGAAADGVGVAPSPDGLTEHAASTPAQASAAIVATSRLTPSGYVGAAARSGTDRPRRRRVRVRQAPRSQPTRVPARTLGS